MPETEKEEKQESESLPKKEKRSLVDRLPLWIGVIGSIVTVSLMLYNASTKRQVDEAEVRLISVQAAVTAMAEQREAFKEKVSRYTWIRSLFPDLIDLLNSTSRMLGGPLA